MTHVDSRRAPRPAALLLAVLIGLTGCSTSIGGSAEPDPAAVRLDTGNFPVTPRTVEAVSATDAWQQEGFNMADAVVAPFDVRPTVSVKTTDISTLSQPIVHPVQLFDPRTEAKQNGFLTREQALKLQSVAFQTGFLAEAADAETNPTVHVRTGLLRFYDDDAAQRALEILRDRAAAVPPAIAKVPGAVVVGDYPRLGYTRLAAATRTGNLIAVTSATTRTAADGPGLVAELLTAQVAKAPTYQQGAPQGQYRLIPMDKDGIMSRTLPSAAAAEPSVLGLSSRVMFMDGYRSARTEYLIDLDKSRYDRSIRNGVDLVGWTTPSQVFRARDKKGAYDYVNSTKPTSTSASATPDPTVNRIPGIAADQALCTQGASSTGCTLVVGRYLIMSVNNTLELARQATAALYEINKAAGEN